MTVSIFSAEMIVNLAFFGLVIFTLVYVYFTSEILNRARFRRVIAAILALFFLSTTLIFLSSKRLPKKVRVSVLPLIDYAYNDSENWIGWGIADFANACLDSSLAADTLVYPLLWTWQSMEMDSATSSEYLLRYAHRVGLDYAVIGGLYSDCGACDLEWKLFDVKNDSVLLSEKGPLPPDNRIQMGKTMAQSVMRQIGGRKTVNGTETVPSESLVKWQILAKQAMAGRAPEKALAYAEKAFDLDSCHVENRDLLARAQMDYGSFLKREGKVGDLHHLIALRLCEKTILYHDSTSSETRRLLGRYYLLREMWGKAEKHLIIAHRLNPDNDMLYCDFSHLHITRIKKFGFRNKEAILSYAIFLNPCNEDAWLQLADYLFFNNWSDKAQAVLTNLLAINPNSIEGLLFLGKIAMAKKQVPEIIRIYNRILKIDPRNADAYYNLGVYYYNANDLENAERFFERAVKVGNHLDSHLYLGHIYESRGEIENAIEEYRLRVRFKKGFDDAYADVAMERLYILTNADSVQKK